MVPSATMPITANPLDVLVVGWFPAIDDPASGRFVADQVAALAAGGRVRPWGAAFEAIPLFGDPPLRGASAAVVEASVAAARLAWPAPTYDPAAFCPPGVPVARLAIVAGETASTGPEHEADHRIAALRDLLAHPGRAPVDLVHGHVGYPEGRAAAAAARALGVPFVLTEHATYLAKFFADPALRQAYVATLAAAARVIAVSRMLADELIGELAVELPDLAAKVVVIPNTVAVEEFHIGRADERVDDELLWVGYRRPIKGIDTLLRAFRLVHDRRPTATLRLVGRSVTETDEATWRTLARDLGIAGSVSFEPPADRPGVADAMARASIFVHPSTRETFGVVAAEALAAGLPIVACDSGAVNEVLDPDPDAVGALVPHSDPDALAAAILLTLGRRSAFDPVALRERAVRRYGAEAVAARIADLYEAVLAESGPRVDHHRGDQAVAAVDADGVLDRRWIVVGLLRGRLDRALDAVPPAFRERLEVVTVGSDVPGVARCWPLPPRAERWVRDLLAWDREAPGRRLGGLRRRIRRLRAADTRAGLERRATDAVANALAEATQGGASPPLVVGSSGLDHLAIAASVSSGRLEVTAAPGGLRWLGDAWWATTSGPDRQTPPNER